MNGLAYIYAMEKQFEIIRKTRGFLLGLLENLSLEQVNKVPDGFNNNIAWNLGHLVAAQQGVCYRRAGLPLHIEDSFFDRYKPETKPQGNIDEEELATIKTLLLSTTNKLEEDYTGNRFSNYPAWTTRYGVEIKNIDDAISFLSFHDGLHIGYIMALRRCVK